MSAWRLRPIVARDIVDREARFDAMWDTYTSIAGVKLDRLGWRRHLDETLRIDRTAGEKAIDAALVAQLGDRLDTPGVLAEHIAAIEIDAVTLGLVRHAGLDPARLLATCATTGDAYARRGGMEVEMRRNQRTGLLDGRVRLSADVLWSGGRLTIRRTRLPGDIRTAARGQDVATLLGHGWDGWRSVGIERVDLRADTTVVTTDARGRVAIAA